MNEVIELSELGRNSKADVVDEAWNDQRLIFSAASLQRIGLDSFSEVSRAVECAMDICCKHGLPVEKHFKAIYVGDGDSHTLQKDWKLSKFAYTLAIFYSGSDKPALRRLQVEILKSYCD